MHVILLGDKQSRLALALVHRIQVAAQFLLGQFRLLGMYQDNRPPN